MKRIISIGLIIACFGVQLKHLQIAFKSMMEQDSAVNRHEASEDEHEMHCRGICYYVKKLLDTDTENGAVPQKSDKEERRLELFSKDSFISKTLRDGIGSASTYPRFSYPLSDGYGFKLLQPPRV